MKFAVYVVVAVLLQTGVFSSPVEPTSSPQDILANLISAAQQALQNLPTEINNALSTDPNKVISSLVDKSKALAQRVNSLVLDFEKQVTNTQPEIKQALTSVAAKLNETIAAIQAPEIRNRADEVKRNLLAAVSPLVEQSRKLASQAVTGLQEANPEISKLAQKTLDEVLNSAKSLQEAVFKDLKPLTDITD